MPGRTPKPEFRLPRHWPRRVRSAVIHAISLAHFALTCARGGRRALVPVEALADAITTTPLVEMPQDPGVHFRWATSLLLQRPSC